MRIFLLTFLTVCVFRVSAAPETPFRHGRLDNGLTYYIRATGASAGKADFYLVQNVGALMEEEHQNGLAHVLEHMAFHATGAFPGRRTRFPETPGHSGFECLYGCG